MQKETVLKAQKNCLTFIKTSECRTKSASTIFNSKDGCNSSTERKVHLSELRIPIFDVSAKEKSEVNYKLTNQLSKMALK